MQFNASQRIAWDGSHHKSLGNIALSDGSVQQLRSSRLYFQAASYNLTNRISMPV